MSIFSKHIIHEFHEKYKIANINMNADCTSQRPWRLIQASHPNTHLKSVPPDVRAHRMSEIDYCIQRDLTNSAAPFLIRHHITEGLAIAKSIANHWNFNSQRGCTKRSTMQALATKWIEALDDRMLPALYGASIEIDPEKIFEMGYKFLRGQFLNECKEIEQDQKKTKNKKTDKNMADLQQQYKEALDDFVVLLEDWVLDALNELSPLDLDAEAVG